MGDMIRDFDKETWYALQEDSTRVPETEMVSSVIEELRKENAHLVEGLNEVRMMFALEDRGWDLILGGIAQNQQPGLDLDQLKEVSEKIQTYIVGNPIIKRGAELRASYVWSKGVNIPGAEDIPGKRGRKSEVYNFIHDPRTRMNLSGSDIHFQMERAGVSSGVYLLAGNDRTRRLMHPIPISEICGIYCNPDYVGEVWAYKRRWSSPNLDGTAEVRERWYYTDRYEGVRRESIGPKSAPVPVERDVTVIDQRFNAQIGWPLGIPDGLAAIVWARIYSELMTHGKVMTEALAKFAFQVTSQSAKGAASVGVKLAGSNAMGATASLGAGTDLTPLSSAGKAYDFNGIRAVAAMVATSLEVSIVHLLSDPGAAGSSYGSAANLDLPTKRAMVARQNLWAEYIERVVKWATGRDVVVTFPNLDDVDQYRLAQTQTLAWMSGLVHPDEARPAMLETAGLVSNHESAPDGVLLPNNEDSWQRADIDPKDGPHPTAASPGQGVSNGTGGTDSATKSAASRAESRNTLETMQNQDFLSELRELVERLERAKS